MINFLATSFKNSLKDKTFFLTYLKKNVNWLTFLPINLKKKLLIDDFGVKIKKVHKKCIS